VKVFGIRAVTSLKSSKLHTGQYVFNTANSTPNDIMVAGKQGLVELENGNPKDQLNCLCHKYFCDKIATSIMHYTVLSQILPPSCTCCKILQLLCMPPNKEWKGKGSEMQPSVRG